MQFTYSVSWRHSALSHRQPRFDAMPIHSLRTAAAILSMLALPFFTSHCEAHPASHVDAWARVGDDLNLKIIVFLDNILELPQAADSQRSDDPADRPLIPADIAEQALSDFERSLPTLLTIDDSSGRPLTPQILKRPRWRPPQGGVDLSADGALRLTWQLSFPWRPDRESFVIRHGFVRHRSAELETSSAGAQPCELRLRVRSEQNGRRVEAIVADHQPHRVMLPTGRPPAATETIDLLPRVHFVLLPGRLIHEVSLSARQITAAITAADPDDLLMSTTNAGDFPDTDVRDQIVDWVQNHCQLHIDGTASPADFINVELLTPLDEQLTESESISADDLRIGVRTLHRLSQHPNRVSVTWTGGLETNQDVQLHTLIGKVASTSIVRLSPGDPSTPAERTYAWDVSAARLPDTNQDLRAPRAIAAERLWTVSPTPRSSGGIALVGAAFIVLCLFLLLRQQWSMAVLAGAFAVSLAWVSLGSPVNDILKPDSASASAVLTEMLDRVYRAVLIPDERTAVKELSEVLAPDLVETVFQQAAGSLKDGKDSAPWIRISHVRMLDCSVTQFDAPERAAFRCQWQIEGTLLHWGHRHERTMQLTGTIHTRTTDGSCRISGISLEQMQMLLTTAEP